MLISLCIVVVIRGGGWYWLQDQGQRPVIIYIYIVTKGHFQLSILYTLMNILICSKFNYFTALLMIILNRIKRPVMALKC